MNRAHDAIVVGARCAGAPTAMLLARRGYRVLLVDRTTFPSDTLSSHLVHPAGVAALARWRLRDSFAATGCPPIDTYSWDFGPFTIAGSPGTTEAPVAYCPRRIVLDALLVNAATEAGAELREGCTVEELLVENGHVTGIVGRTGGGTVVRERAEVVIGADGWHSRVAAHVEAKTYNERPPLNAAYYSYWRDLPIGNRFAVHSRPYRGFAAAPTHDGLTMIIGGWPYAEFAQNRKDVEGTFLRMFDMVPSFAEQVRGATRVERFAGATIPNYFRQPYGPGWALVGDAGYLKDSVTAQGITDAFHDAELCASALDAVFTGVRSFDDAMAEYQRLRDERVMAMYEMTCQLAALQPPPAQTVELLAAISRSPAAMDGFAKMNAGTIAPADFMSPDNIGRIMGAVAS